MRPCHNPAMLRPAARSSRARRLLAVLATTALVVACNSSTAPTPVPASASAAASPSASASQTAEQIYATIEQQVRDIRGLQEKSPVTPRLVTAAELGTTIQKSFDENNTPDYVSASGRLYKRLGLLPADADLAQLFVDLLKSQVIGLYDSKAKTLYVVSNVSALGPLETTTFAHEYDHALQDQNFGLDAFVPHQLDQGDLVMARTAIVEGDATELMFVWAQRHLTPQQFQQLLQTSGDPQQADVINKMPPILRENLLFPYTAGLQFLVTLKGGFGTSFEKTDDVFRSPPDSTEQILHLDKYSAHEKPVSLAIPADLPTKMGSGWSMPYVDTLGELQLRLWLQYGGSIDQATATQASVGWGGDRLAMLEGPNGAWAIVEETAWDSEDDAGQFHQAAATLAAKLRPSAGAADVLARDAKSVTILLADSTGTMGKVANFIGLAG